VDGFLLVHFVDHRSQRRGFSGTRGAGNQDDAVAQVAEFRDLLRQMQVLEAGDVLGNDAHDDGATATLAEDIHAEARGTFEAVGKIGRALGFQFVGGVYIVADDGARDVLGVRGGQALEALEFQLDELAADLDLGSAARRKDQVADVPLCL